MSFDGLPLHCYAGFLGILNDKDIASFLEKRLSDRRLTYAGYFLEVSCRNMDFPCFFLRLTPLRSQT